MKRSCFSLTAIAVLAALLAGCSSTGGQSGGSTSSYAVGDVFEHPKAVVKFSLAGEPIEVNVVLKGYPMHVRAKAGIANLQVGETARAVQDFSAAVADKPGNASYQFALAVTAEATGDFATAKTHYIEANRLAGGEGMFDAQSGLKRLALRNK